MRSPAGVLWSTCDQRGLVVAEAGGDRTLDAGGIVRTIAIDGDRAAWVAADGVRPERLTVRTIDLSSGEVTVTGTLGKDTDDVINVAVAVARDGRLQASLEKVADDVIRIAVGRDGNLHGVVARRAPRPTCTTLVAGQVGPPKARRGRCPRVVFTHEGSIVSRSASLPGNSGRVTHVDRTGMVRSTIASYSVQLPPPWSPTGDASRSDFKRFPSSGAPLPNRRFRRPIYSSFLVVRDTRARILLGHYGRNALHLIAVCSGSLHLAVLSTKTIFDVNKCATVRPLRASLNLRAMTFRTPQGTFSPLPISNTRCCRLSRIHSAAVRAPGGEGMILQMDGFATTSSAFRAHCTACPYHRTGALRATTDAADGSVSPGKR